MPVDIEFNWYTILSWLNKHEPKKINKFLPILCPYSDDLNKRIKYKDGIFKATDNQDKEADNLISFLEINKLESFNDRNNHIQRIRQVKEWCETDEDFIECLSSDEDNLSFITALENEFKIDFKNFIVR